MLHPDKTLLDKRAQVVSKFMENESVPALDLVEQALSLEPLNPFFLHAAVANSLASGNPKTAETYVLRGMEALPHLPIFFITWQEVLDRLNAQTNSTGDGAFFAYELAIRKANLHFDSWLMSKPDDDPALKAQLDLTQPLVIEEVADRLREKHESQRAASGPLEHHYLFQEILDQAQGLVCVGLVEEAVAFGEKILPTVEGLLRSYADPFFEEPDAKAVAIAVVILGAIGEARHLAWMLELEDDGDEDIEYAACWAFHQLAKRHPDRAVAAIRDYAAECESDFLPDLADHLWHLRDVKYAVDILDVLLDSVPDAPAFAREQMFATIAEAMLLADRPLAELRLRKAYREIRRKMDRRVENVLEGLLNGAELKASNIAESLINLPLDEFCADLMNEWDDFENFAQGNEDEFHDGDNLEEIEEGPPVWYDPDGRIRALQMKIRDLVDSLINEVEFERAYRIFSEGFRELPKSCADQMVNKDAFMDWLVYDYTSKRLPDGLVMACVRNDSSLFDNEERRMLGDWSKAHLSLLEILKIEPGRGFHAKDAFSGDTFFIQDVTLSHEGTELDFSLVRRLPFEGNWILSGNGLRVDRLHVPPLLKWAKLLKTKKQTWQEFLKANGHVLRLKGFETSSAYTGNMKISNFEGEQLAFCEAQYTLLDKAAVVSVLEAHPALQRDDSDGEIQFAWLDVPGSAGRGRRSFGMFRIKGRDMILDCNSEGRLDRGKTLLEQVLAGKIAHLKDKVETPEEAMSKRQADPSPKEKPKIPEQVQMEIVQKYLEEHYSTWPDIPLPALKGSTPRQAAASKQLRPLLEELLKDFINRSERERRQGHPGYDFSKLARELGFDELA